jgi:cytochrome c oxidase cbb3-type subunit 4
MISGLMIVALMTGFLCITWWAYSSRNRDRFADAAQLPLQDDGTRGACAEGAECCGGCDKEGRR